MTAPLDLDQLQSFCAIADCGSFTEAARRVNKTQSAVSMQIKRLEERLGHALLSRDGRTVSLTKRVARKLPAEVEVLELDVTSPEQVALCKAIGGGRPCDVMVHTRMNRLGLRPDEAGVLDGLAIDTLHSHLACADEDHALNAVQLARFREAAASIPARRYSLANSAGICLGPDYSFDLVRPGLALYGGVPRVEAEGHVRQVVHLEAQVVQKRQILAGESCGYGATFDADRDLDSVIVNIGNADGYFRGFSN